MPAAGTLEDISKVSDGFRQIQKGWVGFKTSYKKFEPLGSTSHYKKFV